MADCQKLYIFPKKWKKGTSVVKNTGISIFFDGSRIRLLRRIDVVQRDAHQATPPSIKLLWLLLPIAVWNINTFSRIISKSEIQNGDKTIRNKRKSQIEFSFPLHLHFQPDFTFFDSFLTLRLSVVLVSFSGFQTNTSDRRNNEGK